MSKKFTKKLQKSISTMVMITTIVWMSGIAMVAPVLVEDATAAAYDKATLVDITTSAQKIAPDGESSLAVIKVEMTASEVGTEYKTLRYMDIDFAQISGVFAAGTAGGLVGVDLATIADSTTSGVLLYQDSGSIAGSFDSEDGRLPIDIAGLGVVGSSYIAANQARLVFGTDGIGGPTISTSGTSVFYVVLKTSALTATNNEAFTATVSDVRYYDNVGPTEYTASVAPTSFVTKNITLGSDSVSPTIEKIETYDNNANGKVDRIKAYFSESMASGITSTANFKDGIGLVASRINAIESGTTDITLNGTGTWSTTTVLNDTFTVDFANETAYTYNENSTGDTWSVVYDEDASNDLKDATGTTLADQTISTTDMARPYLVIDDAVTLHDNDANGQIDEMRVKFSESLGSASDSTGFLLKNTSFSPQVTYTLGAINGFVKGTNLANDNDTIKIAVTESGSNDLSNTFSLTYTEQTTGGIVDAAGNKAVSRSGVTPTLAAYPTITKIEIKDAGKNGYIESATITFSCSATKVLAPAFTVAGYSGASLGALAGSTTATLNFTEGTVYDTGDIPDITYVGDSTNYIYCGSATTYKMENVNADTVIEQDKAVPVLLSATLYETDSDDIWDSGETIQLVFSETIDPSSMATSWSGDVFGDFSDSFGAASADRPDTGLMSVNGKVVTLTASENATGTLTTSDWIIPTTNEVKDFVGNSADNKTGAVGGGAGGTTLTVTPTTAPALDLINTLDENSNGVIDALAINFNGIVDASTIVASDFAAARGSNFSINATTEAATSTSAVTPDLVVTEVVTENGGNDSAVIVRFTEVGEDTSAHPQVKYVKGTLADLAGNKVATFNAYSSDDTKFETTISTSAKDKVTPKVMEIRLKDRNANNKFDQLMVTYSETVKNDLGTLINSALSSTGWAVADHTIAASGYVYDNTNMALTYATTNAVFKVDINEVSGNETVIPEVTFSGSGVTKDAQDNLLAAIAAGDVTEVSEVSDLTPELVDGDVARIGTAAEVYIIKIVGANKYKRHIVSPEVFNSYGHLNWSAIKSVSDLNAYSLSAWVRSNTGPNETPAATDKVYEVNADSTMHWLNMTAAQFYARGGSDEAIYNVNDGELGLYTLGVDVLYQ